MNNFDYRITEDVYEWIKNGTKRIEVRLYNEKAQKINIGDTITFITLNTNRKINVKVIGLFRYSNILDLFDDFNKNLIVHKTMPKEEISKMFEDLMGKENVEKYDVLGIKFNLLEADK
jgi:Uncharacterized conserved protein